MLSAAGAPTPHVEAPAPFDHLVDAARCLVLHSAPGLKILQPGRSIQAVHRAAHARQAVSVSELPMAPGAQGGIHVSRIFITFRNSRTFPGQGYCSSNTKASGVTRAHGLLTVRLNSSRKCRTNKGTSPGRSRRGGGTISTTFRRKSKS